MPEHAELVDKNDDNSSVTVKSQRSCRSIDLYYRTSDMEVPQLLYAESEDKTEIACSASLVPTFDPVAP